VLSVRGIKSENLTENKEVIMSEVKESDFGTLVILLVMAVALGFLVYMTNGFG